MGAIGGLIIIIWLVRLSQNGKTNAGPSKANKSPLRVFFFVWLAWYFLAIVPLFVDHPFFAFSILIFSPLMLFPSLFAQATIKLGWVKTSYWLGYAALFVHRNDPFGGALFYGWKALQKAKPIQREIQKNWLEQKLATHKRTLGSGSTLMHALLKSEGQESSAVLKQFKFLQGCNRNWIPNNLARFLFRYLLARACEEKEWATIGELARYWQNIGWNPFASWVNVVHWTMDAKKVVVSLQLHIFWLYCLSGFPKLKPYLRLLRSQQPEKKSLSAHPSLMELKVQELREYPRAQAENLELNQAWQTYFNEQAQGEWAPRIKSLGCFNEEETYLSLQNSVRDQISLRSGEDDLSSDLAMQERERNFKLLNIKIRAMTQRTQQKKVMTGIQEYEEFLALVRIAEQLSKDKHTRSQVFFQMRSPCWNWAVELWNNKNNKPLAFLVSSYLAPKADEFGDTDAYNFFYGIISNRFK